MGERMKQGLLLPVLTNEQQEAFSKWWAVWPKKVAKFDAMRAWVETESAHPPLDQMIQLVQQQKQGPDWLRDAGAYIPHPSTYLRRGQFLDELELDMGPNTNGKPWHESWSGIVAKGKELGIPDSSDAVAYRASVMRAAMKAA
jgi:hypothetical protein